MKNIMILFAFVLLLQGCAGRGTGGSYVTEIQAVNVSQSIVTDLIDYLSLEYPSGYTEFSLLTPKENAENDFSVNLENELRSRGYTISQDSLLVLSYQIDMLENSDYYLQVSLDNFSFGRMYDSSGNPRSNWTKKLEE